MTGGRKPPFDPRLLSRVPAARGHLAALAVLGGGTAAIIVTQATALAALLAGAAEGRVEVAALAAFAAALAARAGWGWLSAVVAARTAARVKQELRKELFAAVGRRGPVWLGGRRAGEIATLAGRGLDALDPYFTGYLPQLVLAVTVPVAVLARLTFADWSSAVIIAVTLPLLPVFGALVGWQTRAATERQWRRLSRLGGHFLDLVAGLPTLRLFGRARSQVTAVRQMADGHRAATMRTLRIAFLSALVLELIAALAVALVAVPIGLRLLAGAFTLPTALLVLLLTPEAFAPLRAAGAKFHASVEGLTALDDAFRLAQAPERGAAARTAPVSAAPTTEPSTGAAPAVALEQVTVAYDRTVALREVSLAVAPGERVALIGPSGAGKSTLLALLLRFVAPTSGRVLVDGVDLAAVDPESWRRRLAWVPQRPHLFATTLRRNITLGAMSSDEQLAAAVAAAGLAEVVAALPEGLDTRLGEGGHGLSSGQRQRVALARAFLRDAPVVLLDEPTARLDTATEAVVRDATARLVAGRTTLLVAHRPALLQLADRVVHLVDGRVVEERRRRLTPAVEAVAR